MRKLLLLLYALTALLAVNPALAQAAEPSPQQLRELAALLRDPAVQAWLQAEAEGVPPTAAAVSTSGQSRAYRGSETSKRARAACSPSRRRSSTIARRPTPRGR